MADDVSVIHEDTGAQHCDAHQTSSYLNAMQASNMVSELVKHCRMIKGLIVSKLLTGRHARCLP